MYMQLFRHVFTFVSIAYILVKDMFECSEGPFLYMQLPQYFTCRHVLKLACLSIQSVLWIIDVES